MKKKKQKIFVGAGLKTYYEDKYTIDQEVLSQFGFLLNYYLLFYA